MKPDPLFADRNIDPLSPYLGFDPLHALQSNGAGSVVFQGITDTAVAYFRDGVEVARNYGNGIQIVSPPVLLHAAEGDGDMLLVADGSQQIRRVNCQNQDVIFGASFFDLVLSPHAINADGQIAFEGKTFAHGFLVRADPLPGQGAPPSDCAGQLEGARCDDGDPITQSSCHANVCSGNPLYDPPASCAGLGNDTACNDGDPATISYCDGVCVGFPLPVPEPATSLAIVAILGLGSLRRAR